MEKQEKDILEELKDWYDNGLVSALVGAGFSKNVSDKFLSWAELLDEMIGELYDIDIKRHYDNYLHQNRGLLPVLKDEKGFKKDFIKEIGQKEDFLDIVSNYINKKGFRESLEMYIERKIPHVTFDEQGNIILCIGDKEVDKVSEMCFSAHKELIKAEKLQNIYTTNYENVIEFTTKLFPKDDNISTPELVKSGRDLSNKLRSRNIIKIHGSLREDILSPMGFDGDNKLCYIIAKEDYETYKEKHEAFTSLMRIAMLQGKFMLLGFSGFDANYKGWVSWISDILDNNSKDTKIYIIDVSGKEVPLDLQWYYTNHHTVVIDLIKRDNLNRLEFQEKDIDLLLNKRKEEKLENEDKRRVLTSFLRYLRKETKTIGEQSQQLDGNHDAASPESNLNDSKENIGSSLGDYTTNVNLSTVKPNAYAYRKLWYEAYGVVSNQEDTGSIAYKIKQAKQINRFPKIIYNQDNFIDSIVRKTIISESDAYLFALAIDECGLNPNYYSKLIQDYGELDKIPLWNLLKVKEETFKGNGTKLSDIDDSIIYENIQRNLFHLEFKKAHDTIMRWIPNGYFVITKAMRIASIKDQRDNAFDLLANYIKGEGNPLFQLYAMQIANYISNMYPRPYNTDDFYQYGIDGVGDNLDFMVQQLRGKMETPKTRGWIGSTTKFGRSHPEYEKSLRILRYISDCGIYLCYGSTYFFDKASWYLVFKNLYEEFPYPCFFYSIQYNDNNLQTRIGQDFAYSIKLCNFNKDILVKAIRAYDDINTPQIFLTGILNVIGPMYIAVGEDLWFDEFKDHIFKRLIDHFDKLDSYDALVKNIKHALVSLKDPQNIGYILGELLSHYSDNHALADGFIRDNLQIRYIKGHVPENIWTSLQELIASYPEIDITELVFFMEDNEVMTKEIKDAFIERIIRLKENRLPQGRSSSFYLCLLTKEYPEALKIAKKLLLKNNIWHCGIMEDGKGWSTPNYIRLNVFQDKIKWTKKEFDYISNNLKNNIDKYDQMHKRLHEDSFMQNIQVEYLSDVIRFIDRLSEVRKASMQDVRTKAEELLNDRISYKTLIEGMLSEQSADAKYAMDNVIQGIKAKGLSKYRDEFNFIMDKAIVGDSTIINALLHGIRIVVSDYPKQVISERLCSRLHTLVSIYKDNWPNYQEFRPAWSFNHLYVIADFLSTNGYKDSEAVSYWLNDSFVQKFVRL